MPRYFFHLYSPMGMSRDEAGLVLPDAAEAVREGLKAGALILTTKQSEGSDSSDPSWRGWQIEVFQEDGTPVFFLPLANLINRKARQSETV
ncbi:MAG TPA: hypothetical protein VIL09_07685 [Microvirga sp.]|jgi:hypothetical protein